MNVMLVIPMIPYSTLLSRCAITSPEYLLLKDGLIEHHDNQDEVEILCDGEQARLIIDLVTRVAPGLRSAIREIKLPPDL